jgi:uncharacterized delta-60 repeat protein
MKTCARSLHLIAAILFLFFVSAAFSIPAEAQISVIAATPNSAAQGTVNLSVTVNGKGFKNGAKAQWFVTGTTNPGGVTVNSTAFVNSTTLTANITVSDTAVLGNFDIQVTNSDGRTGKGTELFAVNANGSKTGGCPAATPLPTVVNACSSSTAESGCIDTTFGNGGEALYLDNPLGPTGDVQLQTQLDGTVKVIVIGYLSPTTAVALRYNLDGTLDSTFGAGGESSAVLEPNGGLTIFDGMIDSNRNILMVGYSGTNLIVVRFLPDGGLDPSFGANGVFTFPASSLGEALAVQPDGKIVAVGVQYYTKGTAGLIVRINPNGSLDSTFGSAGAVTFRTTSQSGPTLEAVAIQTIGGTNYIVAGGPNWLGRFTPAGALDSSFGSQGQIVASSCTGVGTPRGIYIDLTGSLFVASNANVLTLSKYTASGTVDTTFGELSSSGSARTGYAQLAATFPGRRNSLVAITDASGVTKLLVTAQGGTNGSSVLARYNLDGSLDATFDGGVALRSYGSGATWGQGSIVEPNGEIVTFSTWDNSGGYLALTRYWP